MTVRQILDLSGPTAVMGVLNVTPDSFSDGGQFFGVEDAWAQARRMVAEGAAIIDVGPESTRPGSYPVPADEQIRRAVPVIEAIRREHPEIPISIDTRSAAVAEAALDAGADVINDISALRDDPGMADLAAREGVAVVLVHMVGSPATMQLDPRYGDVVQEVRDFLSERAAFAQARGIGASRIIVDPGIGFGKTVDHNLALIRGLSQIAALGHPVLIGVSRKSTVRSFVGEDADGLLAGSLACALAASLGGASIIRAHDVEPTVAWLRAARSATRRRGFGRVEARGPEPEVACDRTGGTQPAVVPPA